MLFPTVLRQVFIREQYWMVSRRLYWSADYLTPDRSHLLEAGYWGLMGSSCGTPSWSHLPGAGYWDRYRRKLDAVSHTYYR